MTIFLLIILILTIPLIYMFSERLIAKDRQKRRVNLALSYDMLVLKHKLSVDHLDILKGRVIALDKRNNMLVLIDQTKGIVQELCISLTQIESIRVIKERRIEDDSIRKIFLKIILKEGSASHKFRFYDDRNDPVIELPRLSRLARIWKNRINIHMYPGVVPMEMHASR